jgi:hypothetical protein
MYAHPSKAVPLLLAACIYSTSTFAETSTADSKDCTKEMCESQLSDDFLLKYKINVPSDTTLELCDKCTISMEAIYDGEAWLSIAVGTDGLMIGSEAVM